jgi:hypothetical protein
MAVVGGSAISEVVRTVAEVPAGTERDRRGAPVEQLDPIVRVKFRDEVGVCHNFVQDDRFGRRGVGASGEP